MKKISPLLIIAFLVTMQCSVALAADDSPSMEELMAEGIAYKTVEKKSVTVIADSSIPSGEEMMAEGLYQGGKQLPIEMMVDFRSLSPQELMNEGICLERFSVNRLW